MTQIQWTDISFNGLLTKRLDTGATGWGCRKVSPGCLNCYSERLNQKWAGNTARRGNGAPYTMASFRELEPYFDRAGLEKLRRMRKPKRIFPQDMTDGFLSIQTCRACGAVWENETEEADRCTNAECKSLEVVHFWPSDWIQEILDVYDELGRKGFIIQSLTKRPARMAKELLRWHRRHGQKIHRGFWPGFSAENQATFDERWALVQQAVRWADGVPWVSYEPALGPIDFSAAFAGPRPLGWGVCGGESGPNARAFDIGWAADFLWQFEQADVPAFMKQLGSKPMPPAATGMKRLDLRLRDKKGGDPDEWIPELRVRQFPYLPGESPQSDPCLF